MNKLLQDGSYSGFDEVVQEALLEHQARHQGMELSMTAELERFLDEGLEELEHSRTTEELRRQK